MADLENLKQCIKIEIATIEKLPYQQKVLDEITSNFTGEKLLEELLKYEKIIFEKSVEIEDEEWKERMKREYGWTDKDFEVTEEDLKIMNLDLED